MRRHLQPCAAQTVCVEYVWLASTALLLLRSGYHHLRRCLICTTVSFRSGTLKIAEVESRFDDVRTFVEHIKACGFAHINTDTSSKFFVFLNFKKARTVDRKHVQPFSLKPCLYKKR